jgi:site-specific DNA recombinase
VYAPDRLSRKYAYQILLIEEFARHGVETVFVKAPQSATPEDQLLLQFQGMIAEYERAQILERSRRGKRHRARQGQVSVLSGAPYGYRYVRKSDEAAAYYEIIEAEADVVRMVYERYTVRGMSIGAITRLLNEQGVPTRKLRSRWERSTVWGMLRNPAYKGAACFGKTRAVPRQRVTRPLRLRGGIAARNSANHECPRDHWIEIPVPAIIDDATFALAQELLETNKIHAPRRTAEPSVVQGLVSCSKCGYALYRTSTRSSARKIHYYRCLGSDTWRHLGRSVCDNRPVRQDLLDRIVWAEIIRLLEDPSLIQRELDRRLAAARASSPTKRREEILQRDLARAQKSMDRLLTAYQEDLISLDELRRRMPELRQREHAMQPELRSIVDQASDRAAYLRLAETLSAFLTRLWSSAETLQVQERQRVVRLLVKEILVGDDTIIIRHSIPLPPSPSGARSPPSQGPEPSVGQGYLLRSERDHAALRGAIPAALASPHAPPPVVATLLDRGFEPQLDQPQHVPVDDAARHRPHQLAMRDRVEILRQIGVHHIGEASAQQGVHRLDRVGPAPARPIAVGRRVEIRLEACPRAGPRPDPGDRLQHQLGGGLHHPVPDRRDAERPLTASGLRDHHPSHRLGPVRLLDEVLPDAGEPLLQPCRLGHLEAHPVHPRRTPLVRASA